MRILNVYVSVPNPDKSLIHYVPKGAKILDRSLLKKLLHIIKHVNRVTDKHGNQHSFFIMQISLIAHHIGVYHKENKKDCIVEEHKVMDPFGVLLPLEID